jgi:chemotaxis protein MotB
MVIGIVVVGLFLFVPTLALYAGGSKALREKLTECEDSKTALEAENSDLKIQNDSLNSRVSQCQSDKKKLEAEKRDLEGKVAELEALIAYWQSEIEAYGFEPEDPSVISKTVTETMQQKDARIVELEADVESMERELEQTKRELDQVNLKLDLATRKLDEANQDAEQLRLQNSLYERKLNDLEQENEELLEALEVYEAIQEETLILMDIALDRIQYVLRREIAAGEVRVFKGTLGITIDIIAEDMFDTGSVEVNPTGSRILMKLAGLLEELDGYFVGIIGNADSRPIITPALKKKYPTNWELSSHRGAAVVRYLLNNADIDPRRMIAMGLGEYQPIDNNRTNTGMGNNRRIDIVLMPIDAMAAVVIGAEVK